MNEKVAEHACLLCLGDVAESKPDAQRREIDGAKGCGAAFLPAFFSPKFLDAVGLSTIRQHAISTRAVISQDPPIYHTPAMSSFFTVPASQRKRKRADDRLGKPAKRRGVTTEEDQSQHTERRTARPRDRDRDESISGSDSEDDVKPESTEESEATSEEEENAADRRIRLAQRYLDNIRQEVDETGFDAEDLDKDLIAQRLKEDVDEAKGRQFRHIASRLDFANAAHCSFRADTEATTAVAVCHPYAYTVSRDKTLIKWKLQPPTQPIESNKNHKKPPPGKKRPQQLEYVRGIKVRASAAQQHGHTGSILAVAASPDGRFIATGGADKKLIIWSASDLRPLKTFTTHRDAVTGLAFAPAPASTSASQPNFGAQLFSASKDRSLKTYSLASEESLAYVETLFGHQDHVVAVSAMGLDQCVSVGARDRSARLWRVVDETQLKFLGDSSRHDTYHTGSLDCVAALPPHHFVTGSDSGAISLWSVHKKKVLFTVQTAHGVDEPRPMEEVTSESAPRVIDELKKSDTRRPQPRAITALVALQGTDVVLSGSWDGWVRAWRVAEDRRSLIPLGVLGSSGVMNGHVDGEVESSAASPPPHTSNGNATSTENASTQGPAPVKGVINGLAVYERRKELRNEFGAGKKEGDTLGLCIVVGTGKEMRLGRWVKIPGGRNGAMVFEVPML